MEEIKITEVFDYFKSKIAWILLFIFEFLVIGMVYDYCFKVPKYKSSTTIVLVGENKKEGYTQTDSVLNKNLVATYSEIVKSRNILNKVITNLSLDLSFEELAKNITVSNVSNTEIIKVSVSHTNANIAASITDEVARVFIASVKNYYSLENVAIIDKAVVSENAYNISHLKSGMIYALAGLVVSCGFYFLVYYFDTTIKSDDEIEQKFGLTVLSSVPKIKRD